MTHARIIRGSKDELANFLSNLKGHPNLTLIVPDEADIEPKVEKGERIRLGMFPELLGIDDDLYRQAEWRGDEGI